MNERYADVVVDISHEKLDRSFQYRIPPELAGKIGPEAGCGFLLETETG